MLTAACGVNAIQTHGFMTTGVPVFKTVNSVTSRTDNDTKYCSSYFYYRKENKIIAQNILFKISEHPNKQVNIHKKYNVYPTSR